MLNLIPFILKVNDYAENDMMTKEKKAKLKTLCYFDSC
uniref:Uncharacterized protein n=1 Tax=Rhizophora mucronata TaxID=61149 RepID=A0A2P2IM10_RHIMU